jgi:hypothetical protein
MAQAPNPMMMNINNRNIVVGNSQRICQQIFSGAVNPNTQPIVNVSPRNVGLLLGFIVEVEGGVTNGATDTATRTGLGSANVVQNFTFNDLNNVQRINTTGWHIAMLNSARQGFGFGGAYAPNLPMGFGNNWTPFSGPATIAGAATGTVKHTYHVPIAYSPTDLRGAIYSAIVNATMNLQITIANNDQLFVGTTGVLNAAYSGNANGGWTNNVQVTVYQVYLDQLPVANGAPILPMMDLNTIYDLKNTTQSGIVANQDFPVSYANFREFLSTMPVFDNGDQFNAGSDVNTWALTAANSFNLFKVSADIAALEARQTFMADPPAGVYYFDHRRKPINTITFGNMELNLNASTVNSGARLVVGFESFQNTTQIPVSGSLDAG